MGNQYADWDDCWTRNPPQPPRRPSLAEWREMSEEQRFAYDGAVSGYMMASTEVWEFASLTGLRLAALTERLGGASDGAPRLPAPQTPSSQTPTRPLARPQISWLRVLWSAFVIWLWDRGSGDLLY